MTIESIPNLFIVGAPKCGTTALSEYLKNHPEIFISTPKEPNYFCEEYLKLFSIASPKHKIRGEASSIYLHSETAIPLILKSYPNAKIIVMIRNPVEMIYSWHSQLVYNGDELETNFERAWRIQPQRLEHAFLQYSTFGKIGEKLEKAIALVPNKQLKIILFDDFKKNTKDIYEDVISFLGIASDGRTNFEKINENKIVRSRLISNFIKNTPKPLVSLNNFIKQHLGIQNLGLLEYVRSLNNKTTQRTPLNTNFKSEIIETFREDITRISRILNRDLSHWVNLD